jgi:hypothetical protein
MIMLSKQPEPRTGGLGMQRGGWWQHSWHFCLLCGVLRQVYRALLCRNPRSPRQKIAARIGGSDCVTDRSRTFHLNTFYNSCYVKRRQDNCSFKKIAENERVEPRSSMDTCQVHSSKVISDWIAIVEAQCWFFKYASRQGTIAVE